MSELTQTLKILVTRYPGTMAELARKASIDRSTLYKIVSGQRTPREFQLEHLADALELSEERTAESRTNIKQLGKETQIQVICGDAAETLKELPDDTYEFAFVDAAKAQYIYYLPDVLRVLKPGGVIVSDNILQEGEVLESHFLVEKRNRTIHDRMREYLYVLTHDDRLETAILPVGDGMAISVVRELCKESVL